MTGSVQRKSQTKGTILVTGGAGFIGSHTCVELLNGGYHVVVIDNLVNSRAESLRRVESITGKKIDFYQEDVRDEKALARVFDNHPISAAIHFAAHQLRGQLAARARRAGRRDLPHRPSQLLLS